MERTEKQTRIKKFKEIWSIELFGIQLSISEVSEQWVKDK